MITTLIVVLTVITISSFWIYIGKREFFKRHKGIAEFLAVMISLIFTLLALQQAQSSVDQSTSDFNQLISKIDTIVTNVGTATNSVDSVKASLAGLPEHIDEFASTIESLNFSLSGQKETIETTLNNLSKSVKDFQLSVDAMTERYNRKPKLVLDFRPIIEDSIFIIPKFALKNEGSMEAELSSISIQIPTRNIVDFEIEGFEMEQYGPEIKKFYIRYDDFLMVADPVKPLRIDGKMKFRLKPNFEIAIIVYYKASFGNGGTAEYNIIVHNGSIFVKSK